MVKCSNLDPNKRADRQVKGMNVKPQTVGNMQKHSKKCRYGKRAPQMKKEEGFEIHIKDEQAACCSH